MTLKEKVKNGQKLVGMFINLGDVSLTRIAALAGYDFFWIDLEHSDIAPDVLLSQILVIRATGAAVIVRVPPNDLTVTKRVLEMGIDGIIFPMIRSAKEADEQIQNTLYPPYGTRGFGPMGALDYGFRSAGDYIAGTVDELCRFIQIEHVNAVDALPEIVQNPYIDGYIFGPNDLSGSIGKLGAVFDPETTALIEKSLRILRGAGKYTGLATGDTTESVLRYWADMGFELLASSSDYGLFKEACVTHIARLRDIVQHV